MKFTKHPDKEVVIAQVFFLVSIAFFAFMTFKDAKVGLTGLGVTALWAATLIELNRKSIWEGYRKDYKKQKGISGLWSEPDKLYYTLNVAVLWPAIAVIGVVSIWAAIHYSF